MVAGEGRSFRRDFVTGVIPNDRSGETSAGDAAASVCRRSRMSTAPAAWRLNRVAAQPCE
ncbi:MAG: hypothetical protein EA381_07430 [Planctomycetaceae bacterium]|nr:MAG: hypothetical protein EA381_07430 [Planctomycetaceae bacterium]